jgi:hypothetical protein
MVAGRRDRSQVMRIEGKPIFMRRIHDRYFGGGTPTLAREHRTGHTGGNSYFTFLCTSQSG